MATATTKTIRETDGDQCVELHHIDWNGYSTLLRLRGERSSPRMIYLDGTLESQQRASGDRKES
jgi:hypothetical protein